MSGVKKEINIITNFIDTNSEFIACVDKVVEEFEKRIGSLIEESSTTRSRNLLFIVTNLLKTVSLLEQLDLTMTAFTEWYTELHEAHIVNLSKQLGESEDLVQKIEKVQSNKELL